MNVPIHSVYENSPNEWDIERADLTFIPNKMITQLSIIFNYSHSCYNLNIRTEYDNEAFHEGETCDVTLYDEFYEAKYELQDMSKDISFKRILGMVQSILRGKDFDNISTEVDPFNQFPNGETEP